MLKSLPIGVKVVGRAFSILLGLFAIEQILVHFSPTKQGLGLTLFTFLSVWINIWLVIEFLLLLPKLAIKGKVSVAELDVRERFGLSVVEYAKQLFSEKKNVALLDIRSRFSRILHIMSLHEARVKLGTMALEAAVNEKKDIIRTEILVDDLGWANHLLGKDKVAKEHIKFGVKFANEQANDNDPRSVRLLLLAAKGERHLSLLTSTTAGLSHLDKAKACLDKAADLANSDPSLAPLIPEIERDKAQFSHAKATLLCKKHGIEKSGIIDSSDAVAKREIEKALVDLMSSTKKLEKLNDLERLTKVLTLSEHLLKALDRNLEASCLTSAPMAQI